MENGIDGFAFLSCFQNEFCLICNVKKIDGFHICALNQNQHD